MYRASILKAGRRPSDQKSFAGVPDESPEYIGQIGLNIATGTVYIAAGNALVSDWVPVSTADGKTIVWNDDQSKYQTLVVSGGAGLENLEIADFVDS